MNLKFYDFSSNSIWNQGRQKNFCWSSTFCALDLLSGMGETYRLSVMCQLGLGFCNLKKLFESNVLFSFTGQFLHTLQSFIHLLQWCTVLFGSIIYHFLCKKFCQFFTCNFCSMVDIGSILIFFSLSRVLLFTIFFYISV